MRNFSNWSYFARHFQLPGIKHRFDSAASPLISVSASGSWVKPKKLLFRLVSSVICYRPLFTILNQISVSTDINGRCPVELLDTIIYGDMISRGISTSRVNEFSAYLVRFNAVKRNPINLTTIMFVKEESKMRFCFTLLGSSKFGCYVPCNDTLWQLLRASTRWIKFVISTYLALRWKFCWFLPLLPWNNSFREFIFEYAYNFVSSFVKNKKLFAIFHYPKV